MPPRRISSQLAMNITLADNEIGVLKWYNDSKQSFTREFDNKNSHKIAFSNDCTDTSTPDHKCTESDFPLNFVDIIDDPDILACDLKKYINIMSDDNVPCTITGYGGTSGWMPPPYPPA